MERNKNLEEKMVYLLTEYRALRREQVMQFFGLTNELMESKMKSLKRKGRLYYDVSENIVKTSEKIAVDQRLLKCFWIVVDLKDEATFHCIGTYPLVLTIYAAEEVYEVFYCPEGEEMPVGHAIEHLRSKKDSRTLIVVEDITQMAKIKVPDAVFCTVDRDGKVTYYE